VLLSFAQFEREATGERIRDKIAASKKKGIWMGKPDQKFPLIAAISTNQPRFRRCESHALTGLKQGNRVKTGKART
jgi:DNA invertase Pin-like site-specific DNA recombinase